MKTLIGGLAVLAALANSGALAEGWPAVGGDKGSQRYAQAAEITPANVKNLVPVWTYHTGAMSAPAEAVGRSKFEATPILIKDKLVLCTQFNVVIAIDPATGAEKWRYDPKIDFKQHPANAFICRGVAYWRDDAAPSGADCAERIFAATNDRRVIALDFETGAPCKAFGDQGQVTVDPGTTLAWPGESQISSAPAVARDVVIVGSSIADNVAVRAPHGVVHAFDARTGALRWTFDPIPRGADASALGWKGAGAPIEGHANVWAPMSVDDGRGLVFLPTSSPSPDFFGGHRPGDNRWSDSVVALDAQTGVLKWAFQTVHHDVWDYDLPAAPLLATISKDGAPRDVVIQPTKTGLIFTLDRDTGEPVYPVEERPVPQDGAPGEVLSPTQPFPVAPSPLAASSIRPEDAYGLTPFDRGACRKAIAAAKNEGIFTPPSTQGTIVFPFTGGGANWGGAAFDPHTHRLYVNTSSALHLIKLIPRAETDNDWHSVPNGEQAPMRGAPYAMSRQVLIGPLGLPCNPPPWGLLHAVDMDSGKTVWSSVLGTTEELAPLGLALRTGTPNFGGPLATGGGLVFIAAAMDDYLRAFDMATGKELWQGKLPAGGQAGPMSYVYKGRQYVVIAAGGHSEINSKRGDAVVAFALPRPGEPGPSLASRILARPGGRFMLTAGAGVLALALAIGALVGFLRRRAR
ncbi:MAG: PQQ-binding-like beta-propeller repeat protein [Alphaproteobacteria bacterium]|nr:PQQ-binding-like beta-propeller repeat protein [Alphaproteobacteria bacterium]